MRIDGFDGPTSKDRTESAEIGSVVGRCGAGKRPGGDSLEDDGQPEQPEDFPGNCGYLRGLSLISNKLQALNGQSLVLQKRLSL